MGGNQWSGGQCNTGKWFQKWFELEEVILPLLEPLNSLLLNQEAWFQWVSEFLSTLTFYTSSRGLAGPSNRGYSGTQERQALQGKVTFLLPTHWLEKTNSCIMGEWYFFLVYLSFNKRNAVAQVFFSFLKKYWGASLSLTMAGFAVEIGK